MNTQFLPQIPGQTSIYKELNKIFASKEYNSFRALMAYISWDGLSLIHRELENFYEKHNGKISLIIGLGGNLGEIHSLRYLIQRMPKGKFWIFDIDDKHYTFHPKFYYFKGKKKSCVIVGSNNLTQGGLYYNSELSSLTTYVNSEEKKISEGLEELWQLYNKPTTPFTKNNIIAVTPTLLNNLEKYYSKSSGSNKFSKNRSPKELFAKINIKKPPVSDLPQKPNKNSNSKKVVDRKGKVLLLEVLKETGANGTQVQIPSEVLKNFFNVVSDHKTIQISWDKDPVRPAVLCSFSNFTYRVTITEIAKMKRPLLLKIKKVGKDFYEISSLQGNKYSRAIKLCSNRSRKDAKKWIIK